MKKLIMLVIVCLTLSGCSMKSFLADIPMAEFESLESHRAGNVTSMHLWAEGAKKTPEGVVIDLIRIQADYGPFVNYNFTLKGYKRPIIIQKGEVY